jgi:hypothetical protein
MLFGSNVLDFAIGLVLIYFLLSLFCSWLNEKIAGWTNLRAKTLEDGIEGLLPGLAPDLLHHPLVQGLCNQHAKNGDNAGGVYINRLPSYIDPKTFTTALIQLIPSTAALTRLRAEAPGLPDAAAREIALLGTELRKLGTTTTNDPAVQRLRTMISERAGEANTDAVLAAIDALPQPPPVAAGGATDPLVSLQSLRASVLQIDDSQTRYALLSLIDAAQGDLTQAQRNIEGWFNDAMERLSGWYKRRTQWIILAIALVAVVLINADSFSIANQLWHQDAQRQAAVAVAQKVVQNAGTPSPAGDAAGDLCVQQGASGGQATTAPGTLSCVYEKIQSLHIPIGYTTTDPATGRHVAWFTQKQWWTVNIGPDWEDYLAKLLGWAATAIAISLGAPFWFELLTKLVNLRNTGNPPASPQGIATTGVTPT